MESGLSNGLRRSFPDKRNRTDVRPKRTLGPVSYLGSYSVPTEQNFFIYWFRLSKSVFRSYQDQFLLPFLGPLQKSKFFKITKINLKKKLISYKFCMSTRCGVFMWVCVEWKIYEPKGGISVSHNDETHKGRL